jgi:hypothetical protein
VKKTLTTGVVAAVLVVSAQPGTRLQARGQSAALPPCEAAPKPSTTPPPPLVPPTNLRITGGGGGSEDVEDWTPGPNATPEEAAAVPEASAQVQSGPHAYYWALASRGDCLAAYSMRSQDQIEEYRSGRSKPSNMNYNFAADTDPRKQDAAKIVIPADKVSLGTAPILPMPDSQKGWLVTWDAWFGKEFAFSNTGLGQYKAFQLASASRIWTEIRTSFQAAENEKFGHLGFVAMTDVRYYGSNPDLYWGPNVTENQPLSPQANIFGIKAETWTRYWAQLHPAANGFFEFSLWMADEGRNATCVIDRLLIKPTETGTWNQFWLEYDTSSPFQERKVGPLVGYVRNVVVMQSLGGNLSQIFQRPVQ